MQVKAVFSGVLLKSLLQQVDYMLGIASGLMLAGTPCGYFLSRAEFTSWI